MFHRSSSFFSSSSFSYVYCRIHCVSYGSSNLCFSQNFASIAHAHNSYSFFILTFHIGILCYHHVLTWSLSCRLSLFHPIYISRIQKHKFHKWLEPLIGFMLFEPKTLSSSVCVAYVSVHESSMLTNVEW